MPSVKGPSLVTEGTIETRSAASEPVSQNAPRMTTIEIEKDYLKFSAAHFTIFSETNRERLHGHNFSVYARIVAPVKDNGMCFSYGIIKDRLKAICNELDEYTILPKDSPYLEIEEAGDQIEVRFAEDRMFFLASDTRLLPIRNVTVEELSHYLLMQLLADREWVLESGLQEVTVKVSSGPGQWGATDWKRAEGFR